MTGLVDSMRRPVRGLRPRRVGHSRSLSLVVRSRARGSLMEPGRLLASIVTCPGPPRDGRLRAQARGALLARRRYADRVSVRGSDAIRLISAMGAPQTFEAWRAPQSQAH